MRKVRGRKNGKKVVCVETGTVYETVRDAGMQVCYIYRQQEGLTERTPAWATSRRPTDEVRSSLHSRSASTTRSFRLANTKAGTRRTGSQGNVRRRGFGALSTGLQFQMVVASGSRFLPARQEGITDMDKEIRYFVNGYEMLLYLSGTGKSASRSIASSFKISRARRKQ